MHPAAHRRLWLAWSLFTVAGLAVGAALFMHDWGRTPKSAAAETAPLHVPEIRSIAPYHQTAEAKAAYAEGFADGVKTGRAQTYGNPENIVMPQAGD